MNVAQGNLGLSACRLFTRIIVTHVSIRTSDTSSKPYDSPSTAYGTLLYRTNASLNTTFDHCPADPKFGRAWAFAKAKAKRNRTLKIPDRPTDLNVRMGLRLRFSEGQS